MKLTRFIVIISILLSAYQSLKAQDAVNTEESDTVQTSAPAAATIAVPTPAPEPDPNPKKSKTPLKEKIYFGGYVNLSFGTYTVIGVEPMIGYKITPKLSLGFKIRYDYISDKRYEPTRNYSNYGGSIFARYRILKPLYLHTEYSAINYEYYKPISSDSNREWVPFLFVGAGYSQKMGGKAWLNVQILFDVLQSSNSPYNDWEPFYSVGVGVGF